MTACALVIDVTAPVYSRLSSSLMPRNRRKRPAGSANCEVSEVVLPGGVEFLSVDIFEGRATKKRAIEKVHFHPPTASDGIPSFDEISAVNDDENETPTVRNPKGLSRSASVSTLLNSKVAMSYREPADEDTRMASAPKRVSG